MTLLIFFFLLIVKHAIADLWLQSTLTDSKHGTKLELTKPRLWIHCSHHAVLTFVIALLLVGIGKAIMLAALDFVVHFIIDYVKHRVAVRNGVTIKSQKYWEYATIDQIAHYTTYFVLVLLV
jgi:hypothetical protein|tara:strand:- start:212 stop:577 length:366 start_codon:yes stop_codon:yes gene_type:complete